MRKNIRNTAFFIYYMSNPIAKRHNIFQDQIILKNRVSGIESKES